MLGETTKEINHEKIQTLNGTIPSITIEKTSVSPKTSMNMKQNEDISNILRKDSTQSTGSAKDPRKASIEIGFKNSGRLPKLRNEENRKYITEKIYDVEFNPSHFVYDWGYLLDIPETRSLLKSVCEKACSTEGIEFLERVERYQILKSTINRYSEACKIVEEFLQENAEKEINVPGTLKHIFFAAWTSNERPMTDYYCPPTIFDYFANFIFMDLKDNFLNQLVNNPNFQKWAKENPQTLKFCVVGVKTKEEIIEETKDESVPKNSDQLLPCLNLPKFEKWVTMKDMEILKIYMTNLLKVEFWKKLKSETGYTLSVSVSPAVHDNNDRPIYLMKETSIIPFKPNYIICSLISKNSILFPNLENIEFKDYFQIKETNSYACSVCYLTFKSPYKLFSKRDACLAYSLLSHEDGKIYLIIRSVQHPKVGEISGYIRANIFFGISLEQYLESQTKVTFVRWADMNGNILPSTINKLQVKKQNLISNLITENILSFDKEFVEPEDSLKILNTYKDNNMNQKMKEEGKL